MQVQERGECGVLRPAVKRFLQGLEPAAKPAGVDEARAGVRTAILETWAGRSSVFEGEVTEEAVRTEGRRIPLRLYRSRSASRSTVVVFCHGGGWMQCDLDTHDRMCRLLAASLPSIVVSVGYRLAPEAKYPAGLHDCYAALCWTADNAERIGADPSRIVLSGDSAGGNLAAATAILARDRGRPAVGGQLLLYPVTDVSSFERRSYRDYREGYMLTPGDMAWYRDLYVSDPTQVFDPLVSPLLCRNLSRLPAAHVVTAEFDILRDEGERFAARLSDSGVLVTCARYNGMIHGFLSMDGRIAEVEAAYRQIAEQVRALLPARSLP
jgi:acetyl esterase